MPVHRCHAVISDQLNGVGPIPPADTMPILVNHSISWGMGLGGSDGTIPFFFNSSRRESVLRFPAFASADPGAGCGTAPSHASCRTTRVS